MTLNLYHKGLILITTILVMELAFLGGLAKLLQDAEQMSMRANQAKQTVGAINHIWQLSINLKSSVRALEKHPDDKPTLLDIKTLCQQFRIELDLLEKLSHAKEDLAKTETTIKELKRIIKAVDLLIDVLQTGNLSRAMGLAQAMDARGIGIRDLQDKTIEGLAESCDEQASLVQTLLESESEIRNQMTLLLIAGIAGNALLIALSANLFAGGITRRLKVVWDNTQRVVSQQTLRPPLKDHDEIGHLDRVFHDMASALAESRRKERAVVQEAVDLICTLDTEYCFATVSPAAQRMFGYAEAELIGQPVTKIVAPNDVDRTLAKLHVAVKEGSLSFDNLMVHKNREQVIALWSVRWHEQEKTWYCVVHDATQSRKAERLLKESESRVRNIINHMRVGLMTVTPEGTVESLNSSLEEMLGAPSIEVMGSPVAEIFDNASRLQLPHALSDLCMLTKEHPLELRVHRKTSAHLPVELSVCELQTPEGSRLLANFLDVSQKHELDRVKREFFAMISHDLRTPLAAISGFLELVVDGTYGMLTEPATDHGEELQEEVRLLLRLINDVLDLAKFDAGEFKLHKTEHPIATLLSSAIQSVSKERSEGWERRLPGGIEDHKTCQQITVSGDQSATILADSDRLSRVFTKLLKNAIRYSQAPTEILVSIANEPDLLKITIQDHGCGMTKEVRDSIFDRYRRYELNRSEDDHGTGLGLVICKCIIEAHGGTIQIESSPGVGTTVTITLPQLAPGAEVTP